ncbi:MAG: hypothetical protein HKN36_01555 [Hellea sp.]|nr:hypothetical protein [Hellea sp.]
MQNNRPDRYEPTPEELAARKKRNFAIAMVLTAFVLVVIISLISKGVIFQMPQFQDAA